MKKHFFDYDKSISDKELILEVEKKYCDELGSLYERLNTEDLTEHEYRYIINRIELLKP